MPPEYDAATVSTRLRSAMMTLAQLPASISPAGFRSVWTGLIPGDASGRCWPEPVAIDAMDEALAWIALLGKPADRRLVQQVAAGISLRTLGAELGISYEAVRLRHLKAVRAICYALNRAPAGRQVA